MTKRPKRASLGVALIARDAEGTIGQCLDSFRQYAEQVVVCVDELTTDRTAGLAKKRGAEVHPIKVSDWHECPDHGRVLVQDFARARNESFSYLRPDLDWWLWVDSDDVLQNAEALPAICAELKEANSIGAWFPYDYGNVQGRVSTVFHRERLLRAEVGWKWRYRVHEVVEPQSDQRNGWQIREDVRLFHVDRKRSEPAAQRNLRLLELDLEDAPNDGRTLFYLGNQYFALQDWEAAAFWYERLLDVDTNPYQRWQSACYLSMAYQRMGAIVEAENAALRAVASIPHHPEPYYQLAAIANMKGDPDRCVYWTREARNDKQPPPFFVFKNPLDYSFNNRVVLADALGRLGRVPEARAELEQAAAVLPDEVVTQGITRYQNLERWAELASAYATLATTLPDEAKIALWDALNLPPEVRQFGRARDVVVPALLRQRPSTQPRIVFWCGRSFEEWAPPVVNTTGIGGSETAVIEIAKRFAAKGWRADVYNGAGRYEGVYDGVGYWEPERARFPEAANVLVCWRQPQYDANAFTMQKSVLWCHDLNYGPTNQMRQWDCVLGVSQWHANYLSQVYGIEADYVPNGINLERFQDAAQKRVAMQCVYTSSPDRGLEGLLHLWPRIVEKEPGARLVVAYGFDTMDRMIEGGRHDLAVLKHRLMSQMENTPNVEYVGRLPQDKLAQLFSESYAWLYPTQFLEVSCITAMEAMAGGCVPVTSAVGALTETIGGFGITIPGAPWSRAFGDFFSYSVLGVLTQPDVRMPLSLNGPKRAAQLTWDMSAERWFQIVEGLLGDIAKEDAELQSVAPALQELQLV